MIDKLECDNLNGVKEPIKPLKKCGARADIRHMKLKRVVSASGISPQRIKNHELHHAALSRTEKIRSLRLRYQSDEPGLVDKVNNILEKDKKLSDGELNTELDNLGDEDLGELFLITSFGNY